MIFNEFDSSKSYTVGVSIAIGSLLYNHSKMISRGETSIEKHINNSERKKYAARDEVRTDFE